ncbi:hypothetical protein Goklo_002068 [Gossypium klotzschianum]|uniref:Uncharacterized protein n=1 Tax=Gossypium klotzschianum TaxID=34286 RepID=A0A7J8VT25_9ROSI|nr:hypothetical protein [Gossypium klotzschianum]
MMQNRIMKTGTCMITTNTISKK